MAAQPIVPNLAVFKEKQDKVKQALKAFDRRAEDITDQRSSIESNIHTEVNQLHKLLDKRKEELESSLALQTEEKLAKLEAHKNQVEILYARISSCLEVVSEGEESDMMTPINQIMGEFGASTIQPQTEADIELVTEGIEQVHQACREFSEIICDPFSIENTTATGNGLKSAISGEQTTVEVKAKTKNNKECKNPHLTAELFHIKSSVTVECEVNHVNDRHTITYRPIRRGKHSLHIRINEKHIQGSPYTIAVTPSLQSLHEPLRVVGGFNRPFGVTTNSKGHMIVTEKDQHYISVLTSEGENLFKFGTKGINNGQLNAPFGVTVDEDDNIYVADYKNNRIQKFTTRGEFIKTVGSRGSNDLQFDHPSDITFNKTDRYLYVCDQLNHRIQVLSTDLTLIRCFGAKGSGNGQFDTPKSVAFNDTTNLYVTDYHNGRVQIFSPEGQFLRAITNKANGKKLENPYAIAIDSSDTLYISEADEHCVSVFLSQGEYITSFGTKGAEQGMFIGVFSLCVDQNDCIVVSDCTNGRLQIY